MGNYKSHTKKIRKNNAIKNRNISEKKRRINKVKGRNGSFRKKKSIRSGTIKKQKNFQPFYELMNNKLPKFIDHDSNLSVVNMSGGNIYEGTEGHSIILHKNISDFDTLLNILAVSKNQKYSQLFKVFQHEWNKVKDNDYEKASDLITNMLQLFNSHKMWTRVIGNDHTHIKQFLEYKPYNMFNYSEDWSVDLFPVSIRKDSTYSFFEKIQSLVIRGDTVYMFLNTIDGDQLNCSIVEAVIKNNILDETKITSINDRELQYRKSLVLDKENIYINYFESLSIVRVINQSNNTQGGGGEDGEKDGGDVSSEVAASMAGIVSHESDNQPNPSPGFISRHQCNNYFTVCIYSEKDHPNMYYFKIYNSYKTEGHSIKGLLQQNNHFPKSSYSFDIIKTGNYYIIFAANYYGLIYYATFTDDNFNVDPQVVFKEITFEHITKLRPWIRVSLQIFKNNVYIYLANDTEVYVVKLYTQDKDNITFEDFKSIKFDSDKIFVDMAVKSDEGYYILNYNSNFMLSINPWSNPDKFKIYTYVGDLTTNVPESVSSSGGAPIVPSAQDIILIDNKPSSHVAKYPKLDLLMTNFKDKRSYYYSEEEKQKDKYIANIYYHEYKDGDGADGKGSWTPRQNTLMTWTNDSLNMNKDYQYGPTYKKYAMADDTYVFFTEENWQIKIDVLNPKWSRFAQNPYNFTDNNSIHTNWFIPEQGNVVRVRRSPRNPGIEYVLRVTYIKPDKTKTHRLLLKNQADLDTLIDLTVKKNGRRAFFEWINDKLPSIKGYQELYGKFKSLLKEKKLSNLKDIAAFMKILELYLNEKVSKVKAILLTKEDYDKIYNEGSNTDDFKVTQGTLGNSISLNNLHKPGQVFLGDIEDPIYTFFKQGFVVGYDPLYNSVRDEEVRRWSPDGRRNVDTQTDPEKHYYDQVALDHLFASPELSWDEDPDLSNTEVTYKINGISNADTENNFKVLKDITWKQPYCLNSQEAKEDADKADLNPEPEPDLNPEPDPEPESDPEPEPDPESDPNACSNYKEEWDSTFEGFLDMSNLNNFFKPDPSVTSNSLSPIEEMLSSIYNKQIEKISTGSKIFVFKIEKELYPESEEIFSKDSVSNFNPFTLCNYSKQNTRDIHDISKKEDFIKFSLTPDRKLDCTKNLEWYLRDPLYRYTHLRLNSSKDNEANVEYYSGNYNMSEKINNIPPPVSEDVNETKLSNANIGNDSSITDYYREGRKLRQLTQYLSKENDTSQPSYDSLNTSKNLFPLQIQINKQILSSLEQSCKLKKQERFKNIMTEYGLNPKHWNMNDSGSIELHKDILGDTMKEHLKDTYGVIPYKGDQSIKSLGDFQKLIDQGNLHAISNVITEKQQKDDNESKRKHTSTTGSIEEAVLLAEMWKQTNKNLVLNMKGDLVDIKFYGQNRMSDKIEGLRRAEIGSPTSQDQTQAKEVDSSVVPNETTWQNADKKVLYTLKEYDNNNELFGKTSEPEITNLESLLAVYTAFLKHNAIEDPGLDNNLRELIKSIISKSPVGGSGSNEGSIVAAITASINSGKTDERKDPEGEVSGKKKLNIQEQIFGEELVVKYNNIINPVDLFDIAEKLKLPICLNPNIEGHKEWLYFPTNLNDCGKIRFIYSPALILTYSDGKLYRLETGPNSNIYIKSANDEEVGAGAVACENYKEEVTKNIEAFMSEINTNKGNN